MQGHARAVGVVRGKMIASKGAYEWAPLDKRRNLWWCRGGKGENFFCWKWCAFLL